MSLILLRIHARDASSKSIATSVPVEVQAYTGGVNSLRDALRVFIYILCGVQGLFHFCIERGILAEPYETFFNRVVLVVGIEFGNDAATASVVKDIVGMVHVVVFVDKVDDALNFLRRNDNIV